MSENYVIIIAIKVYTALLHMLICTSHHLAIVTLTQVHIRK